MTGGCLGKLNRNNKVRLYFFQYTKFTYQTIILNSLSVFAYLISCKNIEKRVLGLHFKDTKFRKCFFLTVVKLKVKGYPLDRMHFRSKKCFIII